MDTAIIVPGRLASQRFPRKLLHPVAGVPLIVRTARRLREAAPELPLWFAVDSEELAGVLEIEGFRAILTDPGLPSGSDRLAAANREIGARYVINVQADEPLVEGDQIQALSGMLARGSASMVTLGHRFASLEEWRNPARVKVLLGREGQALTFSRAPLPWVRDRADGSPDLVELGRLPVLLHLGLYGYQAEFLEAFTALEPGVLEQAEKLEQLRAVEHGYRIAVAETPYRSYGVDTPADAFALEGRYA